MLINQLIIVIIIFFFLLLLYNDLLLMADITAVRLIKEKGQERKRKYIQ